jgi:hypothetical protein
VSKKDQVLIVAMILVAFVAASAKKVATSNGT